MHHHPVSNSVVLCQRPPKTPCIHHRRVNAALPRLPRHPAHVPADVSRPSAGSGRASEMPPVGKSSVANPAGGGGGGVASVVPGGTAGGGGGGGVGGLVLEMDVLINRTATLRYALRTPKTRPRRRALGSSRHVLGGAPGRDSQSRVRAGVSEDGNPLYRRQVLWCVRGKIEFIVDGCVFLFLLFCCRCCRCRRRCRCCRCRRCRCRRRRRRRPLERRYRSRRSGFPSPPPLIHLTRRVL